MSKNKNIIKEKAAEKAAARRRDVARIENGEDPGQLQRENSAFPVDSLRKANISNLAEAVGR